jgi:CMP-N,N'-diacetyllegionaminic acid synthase
MIDGQTVLAVIPARAGSKRVPDKNLRDYRGKPLLQWAIDGAKGSKYIDRFFVSSDSPAILALADTLDAPILQRPAWLSGDSAMNEGVLIHTLFKHYWADWVVLLQPTSPLRTAADIDTCIERAQIGRGCITFNEHGRRNGAVYVTRSTELIAHAAFHPNTFDQFLIMPNERSLDIDYATDFDA